MAASLAVPAATATAFTSQGWNEENIQLPQQGGGGMSWASPDRVIYQYTGDELPSTFEDDYWLQGPQPNPWFQTSFPQPYTWAQQDEFQGMHNAPSDDDLWLQGASPQPWFTFTPQPFVWEQHEVVPVAVIFVPDEDYLPPVVQGAWASVPFLGAADETFASIYDEDYWQTPTATPWANTLFQQPASDDDSYFIVSVVVFDEDYWTGPQQYQPWYSLSLQAWTSEQGEYPTPPGPGPTAVGRSARFGLQMPRFR